jgi:hypothetical protein
MKLKALQEKENKAAIENKVKRGNESQYLDQDSDEKI